MSQVQSKSSWDVDMVAAGRCFVGLEAVDLALRLFALNWLSGLDARLPEIPLWAEENGIGGILRSKPSDAGLTRDQLAARMEVSDTTVDNWLDGAGTGRAGITWDLSPRSSPLAPPTWWAHYWAGLVSKAHMEFLWWRLYR